MKGKWRLVIGILGLIAFLVLRYIWGLSTAVSAQPIGRVELEGDEPPLLAALTFDDGPSPTFTDKILDCLRENGVPATFFVVGMRVERMPEIVARIAEEGHELGNHTYSHPEMKGLNDHDLYEEISKTQEAVQKACGVTPIVFRPPMGLYTTHIISAVEEFGCDTVLWTRDSRDWLDPGVDAIVQNVRRNISSGDIILFHDCGGDRTQTLEALPIIINELKKKGYQLVTVSELLGYGEPKAPVVAPKGE